MQKWNQNLRNSSAIVTKTCGYFQFTLKCMVLKGKQTTQESLLSNRGEIFFPPLQRKETKIADYYACSLAHFPLHTQPPIALGFVVCVCVSVFWVVSIHCSVPNMVVYVVWMEWKGCGRNKSLNSPICWRKRGARKQANGEGSLKMQCCLFLQFIHTDLG